MHNTALQAKGRVTEFRIGRDFGVDLTQPPHAKGRKLQSRVVRNGHRVIIRLESRLPDFLLLLSAAKMSSLVERARPSYGLAQDQPNAPPHANHVNHPCQYAVSSLPGHYKLWSPLRNATPRTVESSQNIQGKFLSASMQPVTQVFPSPH